MPCFSRPPKSTSMASTIASVPSARIVISALNASMAHPVSALAGDAGASTTIAATATTRARPFTRGRCYRCVARSRAEIDGGAFDDRACRDHDPHLRPRRRLILVLRRRDRTVHDDFEGGAMQSLDALGWDPAWEAVRSTFAFPECAPARVAVQHRGGYVLYGPEGERAGSVSGRLRHEARTAADFPAVGDWVLAHEGVIHAVLPRRSAFARKA